MEEYLKRLSKDDQTDNINKYFKEGEKFRELMMFYDCALQEVRTKFEVLDREFSVRYQRNPVESIRTRVKTPSSLLDKLRRRNLPITLESIEHNITDVAGARIICSFIDDIYALTEMFLRQDDISVVTVKDYISTPKPNGYRSLHYIIETPIFLSNEKRSMKVEVQFRTIAMDFWASLEHKLRYKKSISDSSPIVQELRSCAEAIALVDGRMNLLHHRIEASE